MALPAFVRISLYLFSGPIIWAVHFATIYGFTGLVCARRLEASLALWGTGLASLIALLATGLCILRVRRHPLLEVESQANKIFIRWCTAAFGTLAMLAIVLEAIPALIVPVCA